MVNREGKCYVRWNGLAQSGTCAPSFYNPYDQSAAATFLRHNRSYINTSATLSTLVTVKAACSVSSLSTPWTRDAMFGGGGGRRRRVDILGIGS